MMNIGKVLRLFKSSNKKEVDSFLFYPDKESANLRDANLKGANLEGANLRGANLRGANLSVRYSVEQIYLEYVNNYLTIEKFAEHNSIPVDMARELISIGRYIHEGNHIDK